MIAAAGLTAQAQNYLDRSSWNWSTSSECAPENDITGLEGIHDGDSSTCWHTNWHAQSGTPERSNPHWVMIDRGSAPALAYGLSYLPRQNSETNPATACTSFAIYFSDAPFTNVPATSQADIESALGKADLYGNWDGTADEKTATFEKPTSARYILFVNLQSNGSSSAACAEMNLIGDGSEPDVKNPFNAIKIVTPEGESHRIAIDGEHLAFSMVDGNIRMGNSDITVEYAMTEVKYFQPEQYEFPADKEFYDGPKTDIYSQPEPPVDPIDPIDPVDPVDPVDPGESGIDATGTPTLTLARSGDRLTVSGITAGSEATLHSVSGILVGSAPVSASGTTVLSIGNLPRATYLLTASGSTIKIII